MCQQHKDLFSPSFLSWQNSPLTVSTFVWPRFSAAGVGIKARKRERDTRASSTATGISHYLHPVKNCPISSLDKTRHEFKNITWKHTPQIPESLLLFLYHSPEPLRIGKKKKGNYLQWKALKEGKMLRFHFWCTIDRSVISGGFYSITGLRCWNTQRVREGNGVLPRHQRKPCSWVFCCCLCPGPLRTSRRDRSSLSAEMSAPRVLSEFGLSALTVLIPLPSVRTPPSQPHSQLKPMLHPTLPSPQALPSPCRPPRAHSLCTFVPDILSTVDDPFWTSTFFH